jgi:error-prone DNA polymerase
VVWEQVYEKHRRTVLTASMLGVVGRVQREGDVIHIVAYKLIDLSAELARLGGRDTAFPLPFGRGDEARHGSHGPDPRGLRPEAGQLGERLEPLRQKTRDFH